MDFTGADLTGIRFFDLVIRDCRFDQARFGDLRVWRTRIENSSFRRADLAGASLGT